MQKDPFLNLVPAERTSFFIKAAEGTTLPPQAIEKDWWVTKVLQAIRSLDYYDSVQFKGGTSLSKGWGLISRFSEDVDLSIDRVFLGFPGELSKSQVSDKLRRKAKGFTLSQFYDELPSALESVGIPREAYRLSNNDNGVPTQDPVQIYIDYDSAFPPEGYILPRVMLEVSGRSYEAAVSKRKVCSLMDERLPGNAFSSSPFMVFTVEPERTFIEKVCLLHEEFNKSPGDIRSYRMSRHLYDLFMMCSASTKRLSPTRSFSKELSCIVLFITGLMVLTTTRKPQGISTFSLRAYPTAQHRAKRYEMEEDSSVFPWSKTLSERRVIVLHSLFI